MARTLGIRRNDGMNSIASNDGDNSDSSDDSIQEINSSASAVVETVDKSKKKGPEGANSSTAANDATGSNSVIIHIHGEPGDAKFRVSRTIRLGKMFEEYCRRKGIQKRGLRFNFDGSRARDGHTPNSLNMGEEENIEVFGEQTGGGSSND